MNSLLFLSDFNQSRIVFKHFRKSPKQYESLFGGVGVIPYSYRSMFHMQAIHNNESFMCVINDILAYTIVK
jgi:hypothetical protein